MTAPDPAVRSDATDGPLTVPALLADFAARGEHPLFVTPSDRLTYVDADVRSALLARRLLAAGVGTVTAISADATNITFTLTLGAKIYWYALK